jgi:L-2,4-diaminobutyrate transaminase
VDEMIGRAKRAIDRVTDELVRAGDLKTGQQEAAFTI